MNLELEDPLDYLRCSTILEFSRGARIYEPGQPSKCIYLVIGGKVKITRISDGGRPVVVDIYGDGEFFGESAFLGFINRSELAVALTPTKVMMWTVSEIEERSMTNPRLAMSIMQLFVHRSNAFSKRIESLSFDSVGTRLTEALIRFGARHGYPSSDGSFEISGITHELISQYVGTSREVTTSYMIKFRREGYLKYSRSAIWVEPDKLKAWSQENT